MLPSPDAILTGFVYISTLVATLRAGSRALYLMRNDGRIGVMEGPLILGPEDVIQQRLEKEHYLEKESSKLIKCKDEISSSSDSTSDALDIPKVSPLWESTHGFQQAVKLSLNLPISSHFRDIHSLDNRNKMNDDLYRKYYYRYSNRFSEIPTRYYSMSDPRRSYPKSKRLTFTPGKDHFLDNKQEYGREYNDDKESKEIIDNEVRRELFRTGIKQAILRKYMKWMRVGNMNGIDGTGKDVNSIAEQRTDILKDTTSATNENGMNMTAQYPNEKLTNKESENRGANFHVSKDKDLQDFLSRVQETEMNNNPTPFSDYNNIMEDIIPIPSLSENINEKGNKYLRLNTKSNRYAYIKAYAPQTFESLRERFGIPKQDFIKSLLQSGPFVSFQSNSKGAARVGGFFFFTRDGAYMVKTIKKAEVKTMLRMLPKYDNYMQRNARKSLLTKFCGMYSVRLIDLPKTGILGDIFLKDEEEHVFVIMNSVFPVEGSKFISERFDLKGSTVGRECSIEEREKKGSRAILKDLDLAKETHIMKSCSENDEEIGISLGARPKSVLLSQLRNDVKLLAACEVMDYSLLLGVVNLESKSNLRYNRSIRSRIEKDLFKRKRKKKSQKLLTLFSYPIQPFLAPPLYLVKKTCDLIISTLSTVVTLPFPYYGAGMCTVDGGQLSVLQGKRMGDRAIYYLGIIDFLQPWTMNKVLEREMKGIMGYKKEAISCMHPKEYASRFLYFIDSQLK